MTDLHLSHVDESGRARMVDVSAKEVTRRRACAEGEVRMHPATLEAIRDNALEKGDVHAVARLAAIGGAKRAADLVPLCHPLPVDAIDVEIEAKPELPGMRLMVAAAAEARTGVEIEAMCGVAAGLLAIYDMCKGIDRGMEIGPIRLMYKIGGSSGEWRRGSALNTTDSE